MKIEKASSNQNKYQYYYIPVPFHLQIKKPGFITIALSILLNHHYNIEDSSRGAVRAESGTNFIYMT